VARNLFVGQHLRTAPIAASKYPVLVLQQRRDAF